MHEEKDLLKSFSWSFVEKISSQGISIVISIILARLLMPEDYGILAIVNVFILLANVFISNGFGTALVQDKDNDAKTQSTDFFSSIMLGLCVYAILFVVAPVIANYYSMPQLTALLRVLGIRIPICSVYSIQYAILTKKMQFQKLVAPTVLGAALSGSLGILAAYCGWSVWALVIQSVLGQFIPVCVLSITLKWRPHLMFSPSKLRQHLGYSIKIVLAELVNTLVGQLYTLTIGKRYSAADAAYYNNGILYPQKIVNLIEASVNAVAFPAIANRKEDSQAVKALISSTVRHLAFAIIPMMVGLALCAKHAITVILTEKWLPSAPYLQIVCMTYLFMPINGVNYQAVKALGKSTLFLKLQIIKTIVNIATLFLSLPHGMMAIAWASFLSGFITIALNTYPAGKYLGYGFFSQMRDLLPSLFYCLPMIVILSLMNRFLRLPSFIMLVLEIAVGVVTYVAMAVCFKSDSLQFALEKVRRIQRRKP